MAELSRAARPWLLSSLRRPARVPTIALPYLGLGYTRGFQQSSLKGSSRQSYKQRPAARKDSGALAATPNFLLPLTMVAPPIWRFPLSPVKAAHMAYLIAKNRVTSLLAMLGIYFVSMPSKGIGMPRFRARRRAAVPTAKALHVQMSEALAAGDKETLRRVCRPEFFRILAGAIDSRPRGQRTEWELVRYEDKMRYPRLADFRVMYQQGASGKGTDMTLMKQAVVSISSVQRIARYDGGAKVPGSEREQHMLEHIVLQAEVSDKTFEAGPWKIWGTVPEMSFERIVEDDTLGREMLKRPS